MNSTSAPVERGSAHRNPVEVWTGEAGDEFGHGLWMVWIRVGDLLFLSQRGYHYGQKAEAVAKEVAANLGAVLK